MSTPIRVIEDGPLLLVTYYGMATDDEYREYLDEMTRLVGQKSPHHHNIVVINDATRWHKSNATQRKMQAEWIAEHAEVMKTQTAGVAFVISSAFVRGGLTAVLWLTSMPCDYKVVGTLADAFEWGRALQGAEFPEHIARAALEAREPEEQAQA